MTLRHNYSVPTLLIAVFSTLLVSGCATTSQHKFGASFLPPAPKAAVAHDPLAEAPKIESNLYVAQTAPSFLNPTLQVPPRPTAADMRVRRAEERFQKGKQLYQAGDLQLARREFDAAVDVLLSAPESMPERHKLERKLEELTVAIFRYDVNGLGLADLSEQPAYDKAPLEDILEMTFPVDPAIKPLVAEQLKGTVSQLPLEVNDVVLSYINYFSGDRGRRTLLAGLKRAGRYRNLISKTLAEEGVPQELIYLAQAESGFLPRAVSHKAATGMWQFVQARGREYGLKQTAHHDDRLDPEKATRSAARHLRDLYKQFGDWYLAIAGYNCGPGCVDKAVQRTGYADFWELRARKAIPRETANYVPIIVAMTIMAKNPSAYGLDEIEVESPLEYDTLKLDSPTHLTLVADVVDRPVSELRELNPALLRNVAPAGYELKVPKGTSRALMAGLQAIPENRRTSWRVHRVSSGDTLATIAKQYRTSVSALAAANNGSDVAVEGGVLVVPAAAVQEKRTKTSASKRHVRAKRNTGKAKLQTARSAARSKASSAASKRAPRKAALQRASLR